MIMSHIVIYGPPGSGKTTIGQILARHLEFPFIDLDQVIETKVGLDIPGIMEQKGESAFRDLETATLREVINGKESVIALGGGSLLRDDNRTLVEDNGRVILLMAEVDTLLNRLGSDSNKRPLLQGDMREKLSSLLANRKNHYNSFPLSVHVDGKTAGQNAQQVQIALGRYHLSAMGHYDVLVQGDGIEQIGDLLQRRGLQNPIVVTDENVEKLHGGKAVASLQTSGFDPTILTIPAGETHKNLDTITNLWHGFIVNGLDRRGTVLSLGGGVVSDLAGFAASTFMRGVRWVAIPTTMLSMVDASLGGKTGFDLPEGKNLIGSFYPPELVLADPHLLRTLPDEELISGLAEVVKAGIISDPELFKSCTRGLDWVKNNLKEIVKRAMAVKVQIIEGDPYERGIRAALNLGHTVGHAVELVSKFQIRHGEAVAIGMVAEAKLAERLSIADKGLSQVIAGSLSVLSLPVDIPRGMPREDLIRAMRVDKKKKNGIIRFALPAEIGRVELVEVEDLEKVLEER
jgi:shikimate kinase / 3-dehydroquinate synthase